MSQMICIKMLLNFRTLPCRWWNRSFLTFDSSILWGNVISISCVASDICLLDVEKMKLESCGSRASQLSFHEALVLLTSTRMCSKNIGIKQRGTN